ncbi:MAG TPA: sigma-70 family RNA polymerase sigma factor [Longimicrobiales bacterium]|nr:sigma-70 family RNA polymerase sigma factor [Longimicrobiales bacterium]
MSLSAGLGHGDAEEVEPVGDDEDAWLVGLAQAGDPQAFERIVRKHIGWSLEFAEVLLQDADDAEDAVQMAFVSALKCLDACRHPERFARWFRTIVRRTALTLGKRKRKEREAVSSAVPDARADAAQLARTNELHAFVKDVLQVLTPLQRRVFVLHDMDGYSHGEIARELGISSGSSRVHLHNARRVLRAKLQPLYREESTHG